MGLFINEANNRNKGLHKIIKALLSMFCLRYKPGVRKRRKYIIYFAINLLTEPLDNKIPIIKNTQEIENIKSKINIIYKQIKKMKSNQLLIIYLITV